MYGSLDVSVSGMIAQRTRHTVIASNIANQKAMVNAQGEYEPYLRKHVFFAPGDPTASTPEGRALGVHVKEIESDPTALRERHDPTSPFADERGYVVEPDINSVVEQVDAMGAVRAYEANVAAAEATKALLAQSLRLLG